ncbi:MAG: hypothetical protein RLW87_07990 [Alphaproteobacteria bacterium]
MDGLDNILNAAERLAGGVLDFKTRWNELERKFSDAGFSSTPLAVSGDPTGGTSWVNPAPSAGSADGWTDPQKFMALVAVAGLALTAFALFKGK